MELDDGTSASIRWQWPGARPVLEASSRTATCCGGAHSLREAAVAHRAALGQIAAALRAAGAHEPAPGEVPVLDIRALPPRDRHALVFATFDGLSIGGAFDLVNDHAPERLFHALRTERGRQVWWEPRESGPERWVVRIGRAT